MEPPPNAGGAVVPKLGAVVTAVEPKGKGDGAALAAGAAGAPLPPKVKGFGAAAEEPKAGWAAGAAGAWNDDFPKVKVDWVDAAAVVVEAAFAMAKLPNEAAVVVCIGAAWPKVNPFWVAAWESGCAAPNVKVLLLEVVVAAVGAGAGAVVVVVGAAPN